MPMSKRSQEAVTLARHLWIYWGLAAGAVQVRWTDGWFKGGVYRQGWEIAWDDGPTITRMRQAAHVFAAPAIGELARAEFPERARTSEEQALAGVLLRRGLRDYRQASLRSPCGEARSGVKIGLVAR